MVYDGIGMMPYDKNNADDLLGIYRCKIGIWNGLIEMIHGFVDWFKRKIESGRWV